jgi:ATP adenylyltransferase
MSHASLHAPWRMEYIRTLEKPDSNVCFLCAASAAGTDDERRKRLVLWTTEHAIVLINRFPYTNGHLLVASRTHKADLEQLSSAELNDIQVQTTDAVRLLKRAISPQGFNIGINLGRCAGAGLPGHIHQHIVPRWGGDTNFMSVVGEVRVVPQAMMQLYDELMKVRKESIAGERK